MLYNLLDVILWLNPHIIYGINFFHWLSSTRFKTQLSLQFERFDPPNRGNSLSKLLPLFFALNWALNPILLCTVVFSILLFAGLASFFSIIIWPPKIWSIYLHYLLFKLIQIFYHYLTFVWLNQKSFCSS